MSCQHREDVCQHCLEKVQTTKDVPKKPKFSDFYQPSEQQKKYELLILGSGALAIGFATFWFLKTATNRE